VELAWVGARDVERLLPMVDAVEVLHRALVDGLDPATGPARTAVDTAAGHLLLMPAEATERVGVKVVSVAPDNPGRGLPRIQAVYLLFDSPTLRPVAALDGTALTSLRTPAMSAVAVRALAAPDASRLVVFGTGPQAWGHVQAIAAVRPVESVVVVGRDPARTAAFVERLAGGCAAARAGDVAMGGGGAASGAAVGGATRACRVGKAEDVAEADVVVCATTAGEPLFDGNLVRDGACVVAVGSHEPNRRELDTALMHRATVVVEDRATALREAGDVVLAGLDTPSLVPIADLVTGRASADPSRPSVYKSVGMAWQDLVVAAEIHWRLAGS
jgi:ornithine cyclodeaminase/alanine dehydrogenase-like protein (mu-crystallin family)